MKEHVGYRVLITEGISSQVEEVDVLEVSEDEVYVLLRYRSGTEGWREAQEVNVRCLLGPARSTAPARVPGKEPEKEIFEQLGSTLDDFVDSALKIKHTVTKIIKRIQEIKGE